MLIDSNTRRLISAGLVYLTLPQILCFFILRGDFKAAYFLLLCNCGENLFSSAILLQRFYILERCGHDRIDEDWYTFIFYVSFRLTSGHMVAYSWHQADCLMSLPVCLSGCIRRRWGWSSEVTSHVYHRVCTGHSSAYIPTWWRRIPG